LSSSSTTTSRASSPASCSPFLTSLVSSTACWRLPHHEREGRGGHALQPPSLAPLHGAAANQIQVPPAHLSTTMPLLIQMYLLLFLLICLIPSLFQLHNLFSLFYLCL
jgi:hypothetical protein